MLLDPILPEIYTFLDFARHDIQTCRKKGLTSYSTHLGGEIEKEHPMPYNVYVPVREFLQRTPGAVDATVQYLYDEFNKLGYGLSSVDITTSCVSIRKAFGRTANLPQINITVSW